MHTAENVIVRCIECNVTFTISKNHLKWFEEQKLEPFKRCPECRIKNHKCVDCGSMFRISKKHLKWFEENKLEPFKRCKECRDKRKNKGES